jgi:hypothetical protein
MGNREMLTDNLAETGYLCDAEAGSRDSRRLN